MEWHNPESLTARLRTNLGRSLRTNGVLVRPVAGRDEIDTQ